MRTETSITIRLPEALRRAALDLAEARDISLGQLVRDGLAREIGRAQAGARPPVRADERLVAPLRARLAPILAGAPDWPTLLARLQAEGYSLQEKGGGLALCTWPDRERLCKASELGFSYARLMRRIGKPFPGHAHAWLFERGAGAPPPPRGTPGPDDDDVTLIEPF